MVSPLIALLVGGVGGTVSALSGWMASPEAFSVRKFSSGLIRGAVSGVIVAQGFGLDITSVQSGVSLFLASIGGDYLSNKVGGMVRSTPDRP